MTCLKHIWRKNCIRNLPSHPIPRVDKKGFASLYTVAGNPRGIGWDTSRKTNRKKKSCEPSLGDFFPKVKKLLATVRRRKKFRLASESKVHWSPTPQKRRHFSTCCLLLFSHSEKKSCRMGFVTFFPPFKRRTWERKIKKESLLYSIVCLLLHSTCLFLFYENPKIRENVGLGNSSFVSSV